MLKSKEIQQVFKTPLTDFLNKKYRNYYKGHDIKSI